MIRLKHVAVIVLLIGLVSGVAAHAQQAALTDGQVKERLGFIAAALDAGQPRARTWLYGWLGAYSAGAATMGVLAATNWDAVPSDNGFGQDMLVGGGTFALGVVGMVMNPFTPATAAKKLRPLPEATPEERLAKLRRAEELLRKCAKREKSGRSLTTHLLNAGVNAAAGIVTVAAFDRPAADGLITFAIGEAVSLLNIFSQPMRAVRDLKRYETGPAGNAEPSSARPEAQWSLGLWPGGLSFSLRF